VHCVDQRPLRSTDEYIFTVDGVYAQGTVKRAKNCGPPVTTLSAIPTPDGHRQLVFKDLGTTGTHACSTSRHLLTNAHRRREGTTPPRRAKLGRDYATHHACAHCSH
jgi:hypothetical protein